MSEVQTAPKVHQQMLIRAPVDQVFRAIQDPAVTRRFWFSRGSGPLEAGKRVRWDWEMYGAGANVDVREAEPGRRIVLDWDAHGGTRIDFRFEPRSEGATMVVIEVTGFAGPDACANAIDSSGGFAFVLSAMKALLEHGIELNVVPDKAPEAHAPGWRGR
jgi:uncharacterized protein YndB with AHSA1/START domain